MIRKLLHIIVIVWLSLSGHAQELNSKLVLELEDIIRIANDSSLQSFIAQNTYMVKYWDFRNYKAKKLPFLNFSGSPVDFSWKYSQEYNFLDSSYHFVEKQTFGASGNLSLNQTIMKTGGHLYMDTDLGYLKNMNQTMGDQFYSTPIRIGYSQQLFGYNHYKWLNMLAPLKFEEAKKKLLADIETVSLRAVDAFFSLSSAQINLEIAENTLANADTLYDISTKRFELLKVSKEDLYTLKLSLINAENDYERSKTNLKRAQMKMNSLLRLNNSVAIELVLPTELPDLYLDPANCLELALENNPEIFERQQQKIQAASDVERARKNSRMKADLNASFGLNQQANSISGVYNSPSDQEVVRVGINVPILDWGMSKSEYKLAQRQQKIINASIEQSEIDFRQTVLLTVEEFNMQKQFVAGALEADTVAQMAYDITKKRYLRGQADIIKMGSYQQSSINAKRAYIRALESYWTYFYTIRKLTLYDFEKGVGIEMGFDESLEK